eukprot:TRINITY_DN8907_c0_g1_i1.p1 TRINITY_DN8907_c0_g1~~TRINITY_DN8907_c0_g1_i1.p1  ORF type:complete len:255 (+),score=7.50 TRINITY_DN8907_c0_g1_i1:69-767(+)
MEQLKCFSPQAVIFSPSLLSQNAPLPEVFLAIRELQASQFVKNFNTKAFSVYSGCMIWDAAVVLARWIYTHSNMFAGKSVLELGSGCGVAGILCSHFCSKVTLSDYLPPVLENLRYNVNNNSSESTTMEVIHLDWQNVETEDSYDIIIGAEITFEESHAAMILQVLMRLLKPGGVFYEIVEGERQGLASFEQLLKFNGMKSEILEIPSELLQPWDGSREIEHNNYRFLVVHR